MSVEGGEQNRLVSEPVVVLERQMGAGHSNDVSVVLNRPFLVAHVDFQDKGWVHEMRGPKRLGVLGQPSKQN